MSTRFLSTRFLLFLTISALLIFNGISSTTESTKKVDDNDLDEDLDFLLDDEDVKVVPSSTDSADSHDHFDEDDEGDFENYDDFEDEDGGEHHSPPAVVDEKDVVVLKEGNFSVFIEKNKYVMVEFYAPWCGHCQSLAPEYAAAATELKGEEIHSATLKHGFELDVFVQNALVSMYSACGMISTARRVFDLIPILVRYVVSWNSMISGYVQKDFCGEALDMLGDIKNSLISPNEVTVVSAITACDRIGDLVMGKKISLISEIESSDVRVSADTLYPS